MTISPAKKKSLVLLIASVLLAFVGYIISHPEVFGLGEWLCDWYRFGGEIKCGEKYNFSIGIPLFSGMKYVSVSFLALLLTPKTFDSWKKFGFWALPAALILALLAPATQSGFHFLPNRGGVASLLGKVYLAISLIIIGYSWLKNRKEDTGRKQVTE